MGTKADKPRHDPIGSIFAAVLLFLLACIVLVQAALATPRWRPRLSLVDVFEGVRLEDSWQEHGGDLPSAVDLW